MARRTAALRAWIKDNPDTLSAGLFIVLLVSPALLELLILRPSTLRELGILGAAFLLWVVTAFIVARRTGLTPRRVWDFLRAGGRLWELVLLAGWLAVLAVNVVLRRGENAHIPFGYFSFFFAVYLIDLFFAVTGRQDRQRRLLYVAFAVFAFACFRGMFVLASDPEMARMLSTGSFPETERRYYHLLGVGGFEFFTGLACGFPMLVHYALTASTSIRRRLCTVLVCLVLLGMLFAGYTLVIVFTGFGLFVLLTYSLVRLRGRNLRSLARLCAVLLLVIALFLGIGSVFNLHQSHLYLVKLSDLTVTVADKLFGAHLPSYDPGTGNEALLSEGSSEERMELYARSLRTFFAHPLTGVGSRVNTGDFSEVGAHSTWLDYLAMYGLPSFGLYLGFMALLFRRLHRMEAGKAEKAYRMVGFLVYALYGLVNPVVATAVFPVILLFFTAGRVNLPGERPVPAAIPASDAGGPTDA
ncbi:MAG: O-antigen ligase family protein [Clostridia bacterium]|nr:O-antigen ligase family protein [Clostridia bacterium]